MQKVFTREKKKSYNAGQNGEGLMPLGEVVYNKNNEAPAHFIARLKTLNKAVPANDLAKACNQDIAHDARDVKSELAESGIGFDEETKNAADTLANQTLAAQPTKLSDRYWHPNMTKTEIAEVKDIAQNEAKETDNYSCWSECTWQALWCKRK